MPGLRLHHPTITSTTIIVPHPGGGAVNRLPKDYHIRIDSDGDTIVSKTVYDGLKECEGFGFAHGLIFVNEVAKPPTQGVGFGTPAELPNIERVGTIREGTPSFIEKMKKGGIIPEGVQPTVTEYKLAPKDEDN